MMRSQILAALSGPAARHYTIALVEACDLPVDPENAAAVQLLIHYMPEIVRDGDRWTLARVGKSSKILSAIENYAVSSGRKVFRLSSALAGIPANEHPTEDELRQALELSHGRFELLPNAMIRKTS